MNAVPRNAPCPCGSGRKHKLCCGTTRDEERNAREVLEWVVALPQDFPHLRPSSRSFDRWADGLDDLAQVTAVIAEGAGQLGPRERRRLARAFERLVPGAEVAMPLFLAAAVTAALGERVRPDSRWLELLEHDPELRADPAETLACVLEAGDVWSLVESGAADTAIDDDTLARQAKHMAARKHRKRLARLVGRLAAFEPCACHPRAWEAIAAACASFERDRGLRERVLVVLLTDSLDRAWERPLLRAA